MRSRKKVWQRKEGPSPFIHVDGKPWEGAAASISEEKVRMFTGTTMGLTTTEGRMRGRGPLAWAWRTTGNTRKGCMHAGGRATTGLDGWAVMPVAAGGAPGLARVRPGEARRGAGEGQRERGRERHGGPGGKPSPLDSTSTSTHYEWYSTRPALGHRGENSRHDMAHLVSALCAERVRARHTTETKAAASRDLM